MAHIEEAFKKEFLKLARSLILPLKDQWEIRWRRGSTPTPLFDFIYENLSKRVHPPTLLFDSLIFILNYAATTPTLDQWRNTLTLPNDNDSQAIAIFYDALETLYKENPKDHSSINMACKIAQDLCQYQADLTRRNKNHSFFNFIPQFDSLDQSIKIFMAKDEAR